MSANSPNAKTPPHCHVISGMKITANADPNNTTAKIELIYFLLPLL